MKNNQNNKQNQKTKNCGSKNCGKNCNSDKEGHSYSNGGNND